MAEPGRLDRSVLTVADSFEEADAADRAYWWAQTPVARLRAVQLLRERAYGAAASGPIERVIEFGERGPDGLYRRTGGPFVLPD